MENVVLCHQGMNYLRSPRVPNILTCPLHLYTLPAIPGCTDCPIFPQTGTLYPVSLNFHPWPLPALSHQQHCRNSPGKRSPSVMLPTVTALGAGSVGPPNSSGLGTNQQIHNKVCLVEQFPVFPRCGSGRISETQAPRCIHKQQTNQVFLTWEAVLVGKNGCPRRRCSSFQFFKKKKKNLVTLQKTKCLLCMWNMCFPVLNVKCSAAALTGRSSMNCEFAYLCKQGLASVWKQYSGWEQPAESMSLDNSVSIKIKELIKTRNAHRT